MTHWTIYYAGLIAIFFLALAGWALSLARDNVNHARCLWGLSIGMVAYCYALFFYDLHARAWLILTLVTLWAVRLSAYLGWRDWFKAEDFRYAALRKKDPTFFWLTSILSVFCLQGLFAWLVSLPLFAAIENNAHLNFFDFFGAMLVIFGIIFSTVADAQLATFSQQTRHQHKVLQTGLWQFSRHPNYLGECFMWWGFFFIAFAAGAWWSVISPLLVMILLRNHAANIEKNMLTHRPQYVRYMQSTPQFLPRFKKKFRKK